MSRKNKGRSEIGRSEEVRSKRSEDSKEGIHKSKIKEKKDFPHEERVPIGLRT